MKRSASKAGILVATSFFLLACSLLTFPNTVADVPPTSTPLPEIPVEEQPTVSSVGLENENLLTDVPVGFKVGYQAEQGNQSITEMITEGETVEDWSTMVTVQIYLGETNTTPTQAQDNMTQAWFNACENSETYPIADGDENGYPFVLWELYCPLNPSTQKEEYAFLKAMQGNDSFYLVQVAFRHEPSDDEITQWMQYLKGVQVCDSRIAEQACP
ncbi:MAG: hypothetical protein QM730_28140 [Anaerolineales bacterium]